MAAAVIFHWCQSMGSSLSWKGVLLVGILACGDKVSSTPAAPTRSGATSARIVSAPVLDTIGSTAAVDIVALDAAQKSVSGQVVNFVVTAGGGSVFAPAVTTDADGHARNVWTLGRLAGSQSIELRTISPSGAPVVLGTATAQALPGQPSSFALYASEANDPAAAWVVGRARDARDLIGLPLADRAGNAITSFDLKVAQAGAWNVNGSSFTAATPWQVNRLTLSIGTLSRSVNAWSIEDWRSVRWSVRYGCSPKTQTGTPVPTRYALTVDSVLYRGESPLWMGPQTLGVLIATGTATAPDGSVAPVRREIVLWRVWADSMQVGVPSGAANGDGRIYVGSTPPVGYAITSWTLVRSSAGSAQFGPGAATGSTGASWCMPSENTEMKNGETGSTFTMTRVP
jgi:hypothetical protein